MAALDLQAIEEEVRRLGTEREALRATSARLQSDLDRATTEADEFIYHEMLSHPVLFTHPRPQRVAIIGAGGIGFDVAEFLGHESHDEPEPPRVEEFARQWGIDLKLEARGGIEGLKPEPPPLARELWLLQRKKSAPGKGLGKTTGWVHRLSLRKRGVKMLAGVEYLKIDDAGLHIHQDEDEKLLEVDNVIICAGQVPRRDLQEPLQQAGKTVHLIGGADVAAELDAKRAIRQGTELAAAL